jgi:Saxitoxin biosynthesis operon protein SxtJ
VIENYIPDKNAAGFRAREFMVVRNQGGLNMLATPVVKPEARELRRFGLLLGTLVVVGFAGIPFLRRHVVLGWPWLVAALLWTPALVAPAALRYLHRGWTHLGEILGWLNTRVILSLLYVIAVVPIGLVMRLAGRDPMERKFDPAAGSYRVASKPRHSSHLEHPF